MIVNELINSIPEQKELNNEIASLSNKFKHTVADLQEPSFQSSKSGQRRLRTETIHGPKIKALPEELVNILVKYGNNPDGIPALHAAIKANDKQAVRLLLQHGANPNAKSRQMLDLWTYPLSALDFAAAYGNSELVNLLIDSGAKIDGGSEETPFGIINYPSPLCYAAIYNNSETIEALAYRGANLTKEYIGTPLHVAVLFGVTEAVKTLVSLGVPPDLKNIDGQTPIMFAFGANPEINKLDAIEVLLNAGANPNLFHRLVGGDIPSNQIPFAKLLLKYGANINFLDEKGHTVLFYAENPLLQIKDLVEFLKSQGAISK